MSDADDEPPLAGDHHSWRRVVEHGQLSGFPEGVIVGAIRANYRRAGVDQLAPATQDLPVLVVVDALRGGRRIERRCLGREGCASDAEQGSGELG